ICSECYNIEWKEGTYEDHNFVTVTTPATCQAGGYDTKTCENCDKIEICNETSIADHTFATTYTVDNNFHWFKCQFCEEITGKAEHAIDDSGICNACDVIAITEGIVYGVSADGTYAEVIGYEGTATKVRIADIYNGLPVTTISQNAFISHSSITQVIIPDSVITIGYQAFYGCTNLTSVTIGNSVKSIRDKAFEFCYNLTSVYISDIAAWCHISFASAYATPLYYAEDLYLVKNGSSELITDLVIPDSVTTIGNYAFYDYDRLTSVTISDSVTRIGACAFEMCSNLSSVTIGDSVTTIGGNAFWLCSNLTSVTIGDSVTTIGGYAFDGCRNLKNVTLPDSVIAIGSYAFYGCSSLTTSLTIPDSVTTIGKRAFSGCSSITSLTIPDSVTTIGEGVFAGLSITSLTIPDSVTTIGDDAFYGCKNLTSVTIGDSVTTIGRNAFWGCNNLTRVTFANPSGWWYASTTYATSGTTISFLSYPANAAQYLTSTYAEYYWRCT
ncbi:MAG: leucine-rich repeat domain-containing protein, partial [Clostridia bacterium]|nr:leucine-rich repeat domain-containing protein [Clostridia bacterium]